MPIGLRMHRGRVEVLDSHIRAKSFKVYVVKLLAIVEDDCVGNAKLADDEFPYKCGYVLLGYGGERLCFYHHFVK